VKSMVVYVLTDGAWSKGSDAKTPIESLVNTLVRLEKQRYQVGIQFIRFGNDPDGQRMLKYLDSGLGLKRDIVDTEPFLGGNLWKMLLGPTDEWYDKTDEEQSNTASPTSPAELADPQPSPFS